MAVSKTVNRPETKDGLVVVTTYFPSALVTGVPVEMPLIAAVVKSSDPSAISSTVTNELHSLRKNDTKRVNEIFLSHEKLYNVSSSKIQEATYLVAPTGENAT